MIISTITASNCTPQTIVIGRRGTYDTMQIAFDLSFLTENYGSGTAVLAVKRSQDESAYPAVVTQEDNILTWTVSETDTAYVGSGECQLMWYVDGGLAKTIIYPMVVMRDILSTAEEPPDGYENWIEHLTDLGAETQQNAQNAAQSASEAEQAKDDAVDAKEASEEAARKAAEASVHAPIIQNGYWYIWNDGQYVDTGVRAEGQKGDKGDTGEKGDTGNGIESITKTGTSGLVDTYTVTYTDGTTTTFTVTNGAKGDKGDAGATGNGIQSITKTGTSGNVDTYTITYTNGQTTTFTVTNGAVTSVAGKTGAVVLDSGDIGYDSTETYTSGTAGAALSDLTRQLSDFEDEVDGKADNFSDITGYQLDITNRFNFISGVGIKYSNGTTYSNAYATCSDFIDVSEFDHVYFTIRHVASETQAGVAFYSESKSFIRGVQEPYEGVQANTYTHYWTYVAPAHYIRVTWYPSTHPDYNSFEFIGLKAGNYQWTQNLAQANKGVTGVVDYWGENLNIEPYLSGGSAATTVGIVREGEFVTLNKNDIASSDVRVKLDKLLGRATTAAAFTSYAKEIPFISGHKYRFKVEYISGESSTGHNAPLYIRDTTNTSVLSLHPGDTKDFTWQDGNGTIMLWVDRNALYTDYKFRLSITDLTVAGNDSEITTIKDKYTNELSTTVASTIEKCDEPCLIFPLVTDIHYVSDSNFGYLFDDSVNNIRAFSKKVNCNGLICLGDMTDGGQGNTQPQSESAAITFVDILMKKMQSIGLPTFFSVGNHDDCRYMSNGFSAGQIYAYYMKQAEQNIIPDLDPLSLGTNYYKDFDGYNTRLICINTNILPTENDKGAYGITNHTISWLTEVLNDMPNDYIGMIIAHEPLKDGLLWPNVATVQNAAAACEVIANCGKTCFVVTGHTHFDASLKDDFLNVVIASNKYTPQEENYEITTKGGITAYQYKRTSTDYTEDLWDVLILKPRSKKLDFVRFGTGIDREFDIS